MSRQVGLVNQQSKGETPLMSGVLQRAAVRAVGDKEVEATEDVESGRLRESRFRHDFSQVGIDRGGLSPIQAKLTIGEAGDKYEQEADRVASQVVHQINAPASVQSSEGQLVQQTEDPDEEEIQAKPEITSLQRKEAIAGGEAADKLESAISRARGSGQLLDRGLQLKMGQAMGADFGGVRVYTGEPADKLARSIQAKAFTTGQDVFFRQGAYEPESRGGQELIAHELTHVVQQNSGAVQSQHNHQEQSSLVQRKEILNLASGTNIEKLMTRENHEDHVINLDRGDMLFTQFIVEHYEIFKEEIIKSVYPIDFSEMALNRLGLKTAPQEVIENQIIKEQVNYWFYKILKGDLKLVESIIVKKSLGPKMQAKMEELNKAVQGFVLGEVSEAMSFKNNQFDEIKMISGYGIPLFKKEALTREVARILKPGGFMIITGNRAVLKSNGIRIIKTYDGSSCTFPPFVNDLFEVVDWDQEVDAKKLGSEHTLGGEFDPQEEFHTVYFKKIPGAIMS